MFFDIIVLPVFPKKTDDTYPDYHPPENMDVSAETLIPAEDHFSKHPFSMK